MKSNRANKPKPRKAKFWKQKNQGSVFKGKVKSSLIKKKKEYNSTKKLSGQTVAL